MKKASTPAPLVNPLENMVNLNKLTKLRVSVPKYQVALESEVAALKTSG
jgi:hypothetical protein